MFDILTAVLVVGCFGLTMVAISIIIITLAEEMGSVERGL